MQAGIHFKNLYGSRFIAALVVLVSHIELLKHYLGFSNYHGNPAIQEMAQLAVTFFFVLSGFLITYYLIVEKNKTGTIRVWSFFKRRILRIWPLYFLIVVLTLLVLPNIELFQIPIMSNEISNDLWEKLALFGLFLPQLSNILHRPVPLAEPLWSIGVEEQFYLVIPFLIKWFKRIIIGLLMLFTFYIGFRYFFYLKMISTEVNQEYWFWDHFYRFFVYTRIDAIAIGAIGACCFEKSPRWLKIFKLSITEILPIIGIVIWLYFTNSVSNEHFVFSIFSIILILSWVTKEKSIVSLESPILNYFGKISYGIYLWHEIVILGLLNGLFDPFSFSWVDQVLLYVLSIILSIVLAIVSYWVFKKSIVPIRNRR